MDWLEGTGYDWIKAGHVTFVIFWMAGLFMLPRYLAYHSETPVGSPESEIWKAREKRILRIILTPAMLAAWVFAILMLVARPELFQSGGWLHLKLTLVLGLSGFHGFLAAQVRKFRADAGIRNTRTWRLLNEIPSFAAIAIVILVIVKPF
jgi:putative membrane protein